MLWFFARSAKMENMAEHRSSLVMVVGQAVAVAGSEATVLSAYRVYVADPPTRGLLTA